MGSYYLAPTLVTLRGEINRAHPNRDKSSDGWIGDTRHTALRTDHNPDYEDDGVVRALDVDKDGVDMNKLLAVAVANPATNYVIWNGYIYSRAYGFRKRIYTGENKHTQHMHVSVRHGKAYENQTNPWGYTAPKAAPTATAKSNSSPVLLQRAVRTTADGIWGPTTDKRCNAVIEASEFEGVDFPYGIGFVQQVVGAVADGKWGPNSKAAHAATVTNMQKALLSMGFNPGSPDGDWGPKSQTAYRAARTAVRR